MKRFRNENDGTEVGTLFEVDVPLNEHVGDIPLADLPVRLTIEFKSETITLHMNGAGMISMLMGLIDDMIEMTGRKDVSRMPGHSVLN
jgi:hypothetical protein